MSRVPSAFADAENRIPGSLPWVGGGTGTVYTEVDLATVLAAHAVGADWHGVNINTGTRSVTGSVITLTATNAGVSNGARNGAGFVLGSLATIFGAEWLDNGKQGVVMKLTRSAYNNTDATWIGAGIADGAGNPTGGSLRSMGVTMMTWAGANQHQNLQPTGGGYLRTFAGTPNTIVFRWMPGGTYGTSGLGATLIREPAGSAYPNVSFGGNAEAVDPTSGGLGLFVATGRNSGVVGSFSWGSFELVAKLFDVDDYLT